MTKISNLPADSAPTSDDYIVVNDSTSGQTKKVLLSDLLTFTTNGVSELLGSTVTASVAGVNSTTYVDFTNGSVTFTMPTTARKVLILVSFSINGSAANLLEWAVREGASVLLTGREPMNGTGGWTSTGIFRMFEKNSAVPRSASLRAIITDVSRLGPGALPVSSMWNMKRVSSLPSL